MKTWLLETNFEWLAHLARHAPLNARVNYAVGSSPTGSITKQFLK